MDNEGGHSADGLSREELYALVWGKPLSKLGPELGLDGARLAKLCEKRSVPYPPTGYWSKVAVGRAPPPSALPDITPALNGIPSTSVRVGRSSAKSKRTAPLDAAANRERAAAFEEYLGPTTEINDGLDGLAALHPKIKAWVLTHEREQAEQIKQRRQRASDPWARTDNILVDLPPRDLYRFRATSTLCHALERSGIRIKDAQLVGTLIVVSNGRDIELSIREKMSRGIKRAIEETTAWTAYPHHHNSGLISSGWLRAQITTVLPGEQPLWIESTRSSFADLVPLIVAAVVEGVPRLIESERLREEARQRAHEEQAKRWEIQRLREIDDRQWAHFKEAAASWREKRLLDEFIAELDALSKDGRGDAVAGLDISECIAWARKRAAALDPLRNGLNTFFEQVRGR